MLAPDRDRATVSFEDRNSLEPNPPIKVGLVGAGYVSTYHARALRSPNSHGRGDAADEALAKCKNQATLGL